MKKKKIYLKVLNKIDNRQEMSGKNNFIVAMNPINNFVQEN